MVKSILVVDDESEFAELLRFRLQKRNYKFHSASNGIEALNRARLHLPDLILMDLMLPDLDGLSLCDILRRQPSTRDMPVILISALPISEVSSAAAAAGACAFFAKPLDFTALEAKLETVFATPSSRLGPDNIYA
jgi:CheY-like chemotaxis protein